MLPWIIVDQWKKGFTQIQVFRFNSLLALLYKAIYHAAILAKRVWDTSLCFFLFTWKLRETKIVDRRFVSNFIGFSPCMTQEFKILWNSWWMVKHPLDVPLLNSDSLYDHLFVVVSCSKASNHDGLTDLLADDSSNAVFVWMRDYGVRNEIT